MTPKEENALMDEIDELEKTRTRMLIRQIDAQRRQKPGMFVSGKQLLKFFGRVVFWTCFLVLALFIAIHIVVWSLP